MYVGKYGIPLTVYFCVEQVAGTSSDRFVNAAVPWAAGDVKVDKDGGGVANIGTLPTRVGSTPIYTFTLTATEMSATCITVYLVDADGPAWRDTVITIRTDLQPYLHSGVATAGAASSITLAAAASASSDFYNHQLIQLVGGTGVGQARVITSYNGSTKAAGVGRAWVTNPDNTTQYVIRADGDVFSDLEGTEPSAAIAANANFGAILQHLKRAGFNKVTATDSQMIVYKDDGTTACSTMTISDNGTTQTKGAAS